VGENQIRDKVFILHIDTGFQLVDFEDTAQGQAERLEKFAEAACHYLNQQYRKVQQRSIFGRRHDVLVIRLKSGEEISLRKK
jgi:hypothetical protein